MDTLLENLNEEQTAAVRHKDGPLLIVAGAGTGKTTVITRRIAYLIERGLAKPDEILALTFTEKAAAEMEERVDRLLPFGYVDLWISTFHSFGERILETHGLAIGLPAGFRLLNEFEQWALVRRNLDKFALDYYRPLGNPAKFIQALIKHFSRAKDEDVDPAQYLKYAEELKENAASLLGGGKKKITNYKLQITNLTNKEGKIEKKLLAQEINRICEISNAYHVYQQLLLNNNALDFGDLINYCLKLFRGRPAILNEYRSRFKYILLDEFQDTNWAQYELIKLLAAPRNNLTVVGDDDQSIYAFRGASMSNILHFKKDFPGAGEVVLVKNYRSRQNILDLAYDFIQLNNPNRLEWQLGSNLPAGKAGELEVKSKKPEVRSKKLEVRSENENKGQALNKKLIAQNKGDGTIEMIVGTDKTHEYSLVAEKIAEKKIADPDATWNDFAVLARSNETAREAGAVLEAAGLPYLFLAARGLYAKAVIMDLVAYLKLLDDYHESPAVYRVLSIGVFGFTPAELINFNYIARKKTWSLFTVLKNSKDLIGAAARTKIETVLGLVARHTALARDRSVKEVAAAFLNDSGYLKQLANAEERVARENIAYLNRFMKRIDEFAAHSDDKSVRVFLNELEIEIESGEEGVIAPDPDAGPEAIRVMTAHAAKGLEFRYVFIAGLVDKRFPSIGHKEPIPLPDPLIKEVLPEGDIHIEEERRLFYVAVTRAREAVYFSWAPDYGGVRKKKPSRFLAESGLINDRDKATANTDNELTNYKLPITNYKNFQNSNCEIAKQGGNTTTLKLPGYFSYTQLAAFNNCPYQYRFAHILKVPSRSKHTFSFGQTMHLTMQKIFGLAAEKKALRQGDLFGGGASAQTGKNEKKPGLSWDEIKGIYDSSWIDDWYESAAQKKEYRRLGEKSLRLYYEKHKDAWPPARDLEKGINLKIGGCRIYGKIDRVDVLPEGLRIVDYKTGEPKKAEKVGPEDKEQLLIYQLAAEQALGEKIAALQFYYLNDSSELNFLGSDKELRAMEEKILNRITAIKKAAENDHFPPAPSLLCKYCDYRGICEYRK